MDQFPKVQLISVLTLQWVAQCQSFCEHFTYLSTDSDESDPIMAYLAACTLSPQTASAILDIQAGTLIPSPAQSGSQPWKLYAPRIPDGSSDLLSVVR